MSPVPPPPPRMTNILADIKAKGDLRWITQSRNFPHCHGEPPRSSTAIIDDVIKSHRVTEVMQDEAKRRDWPIVAVEMEARKILEEMAHMSSLTMIRGVGYVLTKVMHTIYAEVNTNAEQWEKIRELSKTNAIVLLPTHKSYMDFLLFPYLCFAYDIQTPAIAAGMDFLGMKFVGEMLRRCGAFFIRRQFGDDQLYWAVFTEYVQSHLKCGDYPLGFFIEGTRSRTGKTLHPKYGLITALIEPYFRSQVFDIYAVPIGISYDRMLETHLYANELQGIAKPAESTSGLFKAASVLREDYGSVHVTAGEPFSIREYFANTALSRSIHALEPNVHFDLTAAERKAIRRLAHFVTREQQLLLKVSVWPLCALVMTRTDHPMDNNYTLAYLVDQVTVLVEIAHGVGYFIHMKESTVWLEVIRFLKFHKQWIEYDSSNKVATLSPLDGSLGIPRLVLCNNANKCIHVYCTLAIALLARNVAPSCPTSLIGLRGVSACYSLLREIMAHELVRMAENDAGDFDAAAHLLRSMHESKWAIILSTVRPYFLGYLLVADILADLKLHETITEAMLIGRYRARVAEDASHIGGELVCYDMLRNSVKAFRSMSLIRVDGGIAVDNRAMLYQTRDLVLVCVVNCYANVVPGDLPTILTRSTNAQSML